MTARTRTRSLTPEEDAIGQPEDVDDEIDDLLPADLWFRAAPGTVPTGPTWSEHAR